MLSTLCTPTLASVFKPKHFTLPNGLQVVVIENHMSPAVSLALIYKVGTADDPTHMIGLSHFLEHIMFKGTRDVPAGEFKRLIVSKGGEINATTSTDQTIYTCDIAVENLEMVLKIEADRMHNLVFDPKEIAAEQQVVMEERLMRMDNHPLGQAFEVLLRSLYWYHPYGIPPIGYPHHILAYTPEALEAHYKKWYTPNNAILVIAGDVKIDTLKPMVEKYFGPVPARETPKRIRPKEPDHQGLVTHLEFESPRLSMVNMSWYYGAPNNNSPHKEHFYPLIILAHILGGNSNSRLYRAFVDNKETGKSVALNAQTDYDGDAIDDEIFSISVTLHSSTTPEQMAPLVDEQIKKIMTELVTPDELKKTKRDLIANIAFARDGNSGAISTFTRLAIGFTVEDVELWPEHINAVTAEQVQAAAQFVFSKNPLATMTISPKGYRTQQTEESLKKKAATEHTGKTGTSDNKKVREHRAVK